MESLSDDNEKTTLQKHVHEAEFLLFTIVIGCIISESIPKFYEKIIIEVDIYVILAFIIAIIITLDYYTQWWKWFKDYPSQTFWWIWISVLWALIVSGLFYFSDNPHLFMVLFSFFWIADLCWEIRVLVDYRREVRNRDELILYIYFITTDVAYFGIFFLFSVLTLNDPMNSLTYLIVVFILFCIFRAIDDYPVKRWQRRKVKLSRTGQN